MTPNLFHSLWIGPPMPAWMDTCINSWRAHHPQWKHRIWIDPKIPGSLFPELVNQDLWDNAERISPNAPEQFRSDVARYEILYQYGGVWVDTDMACLKPIDELVTPLFLGWEVQDVWANNALLGAEAGHPMLAEAIDRLPARVRSHRGRSNGVMSGPQFITPLARKYGAMIYPQHYFYPFSYRDVAKYRPDDPDIDFPESYALHWWHNSRRKRGLL